MNTEPVAIVAFVKAVLYCAILFGLALTAAQMAAVIVVVETGLTVFTRSKVTPA